MADMTLPEVPVHFQCLESAPDFGRENVRSFCTLLAANLLFGRLSTSIVVCGPGPYS